jgi:beta-glucuronidase
VAAVGQNSGRAGGIRDTGHVWFSPQTINDVSREVHAQAIRELIARQEPPERRAVQHAGVARVLRALSALMRELDPSQPVGFANEIGSPHGECLVSELGDVLMLNLYYGWYVNTGDLAAAEPAWQTELDAWAIDGKPIIITEYGADTVGLHAVAPAPWTEEFRVEYLEMNHRVFDSVGEHVWNFADFATVSGVFRVDGNKKGVFTRDRRPKAAAHLLRRRWRHDG